MSRRPSARVPLFNSKVSFTDFRRVKPPAKKAASIYQTPEFKAWRAAVTERDGRRCKALNPDGSRCGKATPYHRMFADHRHEIRDGGAPFDVENGQCPCGSHYTAKTMAARATRLKQKNSTFPMGCMHLRICDHLAQPQGGFEVALNPSVNRVGPHEEIFFRGGNFRASFRADGKKIRGDFSGPEALTFARQSARIAQKSGIMAPPKLSLMERNFFAGKNILPERKYGPRK